jgi:hypothetical protein
MKQIVITLFILITSVPCFSQQDSIPPKLTWSGYIDAYYAFDSGQPDDHVRPGFLYNHNRHNEFNVNLALIRANYTAANIRANLGLMVGTYAQYNLAAEEDLIKNIYEANAGVKLSKNSELWFDAGIFVSHIGFESAISKDCWTLTRSLVAENSPYYESGAKLTYTTRDTKLTLSGLVLNGWQRIRRVDGNNTPAFGSQIVYKPSSGITLNYSTFFGNDKPDSVKQNRTYHNFYSIFQVSDKFGVTAGFDIGTEEKGGGESGTNTWYTPVVILRYAVSPKVTVVGRGEYYDDENGVIIATGTTNGFKTTGVSLGVDYAPESNLLWRLEGRTFSSKDDIFVESEKAVNTNYSIVTSLVISF